MVKKKATKDADFSVLMIGQRRAGKSSMLSSMLKSMDRLCEETGFRFTADRNTEVLMQKKMSQMERIFYLYQKGDIFSTQAGEKDGEVYGLWSTETIYYRFRLGLKDRKKTKKDYTVEFIDIRGEDMLSDMEDEGSTVIDLMGRCAVIMIAVDTPALMEGKWKKGYGENHNRVNVPDNIYNCIATADARMRKKLKKGQELPPKLVLFVPLKCEKYYHQGEMEKVKGALKEGYQGLFLLLKGRGEYSVAITPILTLGDVVFHHYQTRELPGGRQVTEMWGDEYGESMRGTPKAPMFAFRDVDRPCFSPKYCEQPLMYLLAYIMSVTGKLEKLEGWQRKKDKQAGIFGKTASIAKHLLLIYLFGVFYIGFWGIRCAMDDKTFLDEAEKAGRLVKFSGEGYELVQDQLNLRKIGEGAMQEV